MEAYRYGSEFFSFGCGVRHRLGHGGEEDHFRPYLVRELAGIGAAEVACGRTHTIALTRDGAECCPPIDDEDFFGLKPILS